MSHVVGWRVWSHGSLEFYLVVSCTYSMTKNLSHDKWNDQLSLERIWRVFCVTKSSGLPPVKDWNNGLIRQRPRTRKWIESLWKWNRSVDSWIQVNWRQLIKSSFEFDSVLLKEIWLEKMIRTRFLSVKDHVLSWWRSLFSRNVMSIKDFM